VEVTCSDIGDFKDVSVIEVLVKVGDTIIPSSPDRSSLAKASMEIPPSAAGVLKDLKVKLGDGIIGDPLAVLEGTAPAAAQPPGSSLIRHPLRQHLPQLHGCTGGCNASVAVKAPAHEPTVAPTGSCPMPRPSVRKFA
jgi:pyruvate dehydrogenase E2 component (dihydrolipoamide acetyltransferase)